MHKILKTAINFAKKRRKAGRSFIFGAVGIRSDGAIVKSYNESTKTPNPAAHAEVRLLKKLDRGSTVYVARILRDGTPALAKPCSRCEAALASYGVKRVYYTIADNEYGCLVLSK